MNINHIEITDSFNVKPRAVRARGLLYLYFLSLFSFFCFDIASASPKQASLITVWPGSEIYELCGHEAVRIQGDGIDSVWNFGIFNFNEPNFVYRFVKGETDYMVDSYPFAWFMPEYVREGRRVEELVLNLSPTEVERLHGILKQAVTPPNNRYRYNYIRNNCSTRIADLLDSIGSGSIIYPDSVTFPSFREAMKRYHANYPWYQFGIDVVLGNELDREISSREVLFIPVEFNKLSQEASFPDGRPLVRYRNVLYEGTDSAVLPATPFLLTPLWVSIVVAAITIISIACCWRKRIIPRWWYALYFGIAGLAGCLVAFLVCFSYHPATSPNLMIFWLNPLQLIIPICLWWRHTKYVVNAMMWLNVAAVGMLLFLTPIFNRGQAGQASFLILMASDVVLAIYYLLSVSSKNTIETDKKGGRKKRNPSGKRTIKPRTRR